MEEELNNRYNLTSPSLFAAVMFLGETFYISITLSFIIKYAFITLSFVIKYAFITLFLAKLTLNNCILR